MKKEKTLLEAATDILLNKSSLTEAALKARISAALNALRFESKEDLEKVLILLADHIYDEYSKNETDQDIILSLARIRQDIENAAKKWKEVSKK